MWMFLEVMFERGILPNLTTRTLPAACVICNSCISGEVELHRYYHQKRSVFEYGQVFDE